jgi:hypothetical protein
VSAPIPPGDSDLLRQILSMTPGDAKHRIARLPTERFQSLMGKVLTVQRQQRQERQLLLYRPVSDKAMALHTCVEQTCAIGGGNRSSKTTSCLAEMAMMTTGLFATSVRKAWEKQHGIPVSAPLSEGGKFRGPITVRVVCESLTTTLHQTILPKLQWWKWSGVDAPGGARGHWGMIPRDCLIGGSWERSWSEKLRVLRVLCRDPEDFAKVIGESTWEFMSKDQDPTDFASGQCHYVLHDEPPSYAIWKENEARTISVSGRMLLAMTWPDDPSIPIDWIFDRVYEPAQDPSSGIRWINLWMTENPFIDQDAVQAQRAKWDEQTVQVRLFGRPIRFTNRIHALFTDQDDHWCFRCGKTVLVTDRDPIRCGICDSGLVTPFNHVRDFDISPHWPTVFVLDPHPRKPHMYLWGQIDPADDLWVVADGQLDGDPQQVRDDVQAIETDLGLHVRQRLIDPNMGRSPSSSTRRTQTWQDDFDAVGLVTDLADDGDVGRGRINAYLKPDPDTQRPRLHLHPRAARTIFQMKRYVWDEFRSSIDRDPKQTPKAKNDDYPTMLKYWLNTDPSFRTLTQSSGIFRRREETRRAGGHREGRWQVRP